MGSVHKFKRPPKNEQQFRGYRPQPGTVGNGGKPTRRALRGWQKSVIAWSALLLVAMVFWALGRLFGAA